MYNPFWYPIFSGPAFSVYPKLTENKNRKLKMSDLLLSSFLAV